MDANQAETDSSLKQIRASHEHLKEEMRTGQGLLKEQMLAKLDAYHESVMVRMDSQLEKVEVCLGMTEAPKVEAAVDTFRALKKQYRAWHLAVKHRRQPKKRMQGNGGSRKMLASAHRVITHRVHRHL